MPTEAIKIQGGYFFLLMKTSMNKWERYHSLLEAEGGGIIFQSFTEMLYHLATIRDSTYNAFSESLKKCCEVFLKALK